MMKNKNGKWVCGLLATALAAPAIGQVGIYIGRTPPPLRYEVRTPMPGEGYAWVDGYWGVNSGRYVWVPGRWDRPPYAGAYSESSPTTIIIPLEGA